MDNNERWRLEEEHDDAQRKFNQAVERLNDYQNQIHQKTSALAEYVNSFYHELPYGAASHFNDQFSETVQEYNWKMRQLQQELEEDKLQESRDFYRKLDE